MNFSHIKTAALAFSTIIFLSGCGDKVKPGTTEVARQEVLGVKAAEAKEKKVTQYAEATGTIRPRSASSVASKVMGTVVSIEVAEGESVKKGDLLLTIEAGDINERVRAAEAGVREAEKGLEAVKTQKELAEATYNRYKKLFDEKAVSRQEFDNVATQWKTAALDEERTAEAVARARAGLAEARVFKGYSRITSPVSGVVTEKKIEAGTMAAPGMPLLVIEDTSSYEINAYMEEALLGSLKKGGTVEVFIDSLGKSFTGKVSEAVPSVNPATRSFLVKISISGEDIRSGQYARVRVPSGEKTALLVPSASVLEKGQLTGVYTVDEKGVAVFRLVRLGARYGEDIEALSGIVPGDLIVVEGVDKVFDGALVAGSAARQNTPKE